MRRGRMMKPSGAGLDFELVAGLDAECVEDFGWEGDLTFGGDFDDHGRISLRES